MFIATDNPIIAKVPGGHAFFVTGGSILQYRMHDATNIARRGSIKSLPQRNESCLPYESPTALPCGDVVRRVSCKGLSRRDAGGPQEALFCTGSIINKSN